MATIKRARPQLRTELRDIRDQDPFPIGTRVMPKARDPLAAGRLGRKVDERRNERGEVEHGIAFGGLPYPSLWMRPSQMWRLVPVLHTPLVRDDEPRYPGDFS